MKVILASASPRRQALLQQIGIEPVVQPASFDEVGGTGLLFFSSMNNYTSLHNSVRK